MYCGTPLVTSDGHVLGALCVVDVVPRQLTERQHVALERLARQVVAVLELTLRSRRLAVALALLDAQARRDLLTGLANRRELLERLDRAHVAGERLALLFCDLDRFKHVSDTYGHGAGDEVLVGVAERLQRQVREGDLVARFGGDEFVVLTNADDAGADDLARRLEASLARPYTTSKGVAHVGVSVGVALLEPGEPVAEVLSRADAGMYREKLRRRSALPDQRREAPPLRLALDLRDPAALADQPPAVQWTPRQRS